MRGARAFAREHLFRFAVARNTRHLPQHARRTIAFFDLVVEEGAFVNCLVFWCCLHLRHCGILLLCAGSRVAGTFSCMQERHLALRRHLHNKVLYHVLHSFLLVLLLLLLGSLWAVSLPTLSIGVGMKHLHWALYCALFKSKACGSRHGWQHDISCLACLAGTVSRHGLSCAATLFL